MDLQDAGTTVKYLIRDRDSKYTCAFDAAQRTTTASARPAHRTIPTQPARHPPPRPTRRHTPRIPTCRMTCADVISGTRNVIPLIGTTKLKDLRADHVDDWLDGLTGNLSTRSLQGVHSILKRAIRQAQARDKVLRNVAKLVTTPKGKAGRPSKALTLSQAMAVLKSTKASPLNAYVVLSLMTGVRTEEAWALRWDHVVAWTKDADWQPVTDVGFDHEKFAIYVWRSVREHGDTKTEKSRRTLELPKEVATALRDRHRRQARQRLKVGTDRQDTNLVFCTRTGGPLNAGNVRRAFRGIARKADIGEDWTPRELRHSFVSIMSDNGVPIETIADLVGHAGTAVTENH